MAQYVSRFIPNYAIIINPTALVDVTGHTLEMGARRTKSIE